MKRTAISLAAAVLLASAANPGELFHQASTTGMYTLQLAPTGSKIAIGELHSWHLILKDAEGEVVEDATIFVEGGMPSHGHGLPTSPKVSDAEGAGHYTVEGVRFNMPGDWELRLTIESAAGTDTALLEFGL